MSWPARAFGATGLLLVPFVILGCGDAGRRQLTLDAFAQGTRPRDIQIDGATLRLTRADVAFGPLYLCATESAETGLCESALAELLSTATCDGLLAAPQPLGALDATTGSVRSGFFDYGISWTLTQQSPRPSEGSAGGHSARFEGTIALDDGTTFPFRADLDIAPLSAGDAAVNGLATRQTLSSSTQSLTVRFDPSAWLGRIKLARVLELGTDSDGKVVFEPGSQPYEAMLQAMTANQPPTLIWDRR